MNSRMVLDGLPSGKAFDGGHNVEAKQWLLTKIKDRSKVLRLDKVISHQWLFLVKNQASVRGRGAKTMIECRPPTGDLLPPYR